MRLELATQNDFDAIIAFYDEHTRPQTLQTSRFRVSRQAAPLRREHRLD